MQSYCLAYTYVVLCCIGPKCPAHVKEPNAGTTSPDQLSTTMQADKLTRAAQHHRLVGILRGQVLIP